MISTRQLIFIISLVFFFVNRATSGSKASTSRASHERYSNAEGVNSEHLRGCIREISSAFEGATTPFDKFLFAFLYRNTAEFLVANSYTIVAYEYFKELLSTAQKLSQPALLNPKKYCNQFEGQAEICLRGIAEIGCKRKDSGVKCFEKLYLDWKKDESIVYSLSACGTENLSDEDILTALDRGADRFPDLSTYQEVANHLSDENLLAEFCAQNENERREINNLRITNDNAFDTFEAARNNASNQPSFATSINANMAFESYDEINRYYTDLRREYIESARDNCFDIKSASYQTLLDEYNRRQNLPKQFVNSYATYFHDEIKSFGENKGLDSAECKTFPRPENFCVKFLSKHPHYY